MSDFLLKTKKSIPEFHVEEIGSAWIVDKNCFPAIDGVTCYTLELFEESMRIPHWHPNAAELGYVVSGEVEIIIWRSPGETAVFTLSQGMCWFIPQSALHSLNNVGKEKTLLLVGFSHDLPQDMDLPVAFNGLPNSIRAAYTSPHKELQQWKGPIKNPLVGKFTPTSYEKHSGSPYKFDLAQVTPLYKDAQLGSVVWGIKDNWNILEKISVLRAHLKPGVARDPIWYPDAGTLYIVTKGKGQFHLIYSDAKTEPFEVHTSDYVFVPIGMLHTFINHSNEDFEVVAFFTKADPLPEVSLSVATSFFPNSIRKQALTEYGNEKKSGDPLKQMNFSTVSPYLLKTSSK